MVRTKTGFTLIELLIVVAIIAILAAIAIPNFLAAQTRSKVARTTSEMRTVATGLESYYVDQSVYVPSEEVPDWIPPGGNTTQQLTRLTTPIAYLTTVPKDRFNAYWLGIYGGSQEGRPFYYVSDCVAVMDVVGYGQNKTLGCGHFYPPSAGGGCWPGQSGNHKWILVSYGPCLKPYWNYDGSGSSPWPYLLYDPTNGVTSGGMLNRLGP
jgi:prepilin-type N-terminal cleavage/methylation domain-containing protein